MYDKWEVFGSLNKWSKKSELATSTLVKYLKKTFFFMNTSIFWIPFNWHELIEPFSILVDMTSIWSKNWSIYCPLEDTLNKELNYKEVVFCKKKTTEAGTYFTTSNFKSILSLIWRRRFILPMIVFFLNFSLLPNFSRYILRFA